MFQANLLDDGSFDEIVQGCTGVFHTASPVIFSVSDPKVHLLHDCIEDFLGNDDNYKWRREWGLKALKASDPI